MLWPLTSFLPQSYPWSIVLFLASDRHYYGLSKAKNSGWENYFPKILIWKRRSCCTWMYRIRFTLDFCPKFQGLFLRIIEMSKVWLILFVKISWSQCFFILGCKVLNFILYGAFSMFSLSNWMLMDLMILLSFFILLKFY